jgi:Protein of unknown function (DUF1360)
MATATEPVTAQGQDGPLDGYAHEHRPLGGYAALSVSFVAGIAAAGLAARRSGRELPQRPDAWDTVTAGIATHKLSRLIAKDKVTSFLRAPFVRFKETSGHGEVSEEPRGKGLQLAIGELLGCPYCLGQWVAAAFGVGLVASPRLTRMIAFVYTAETIADFLQLAYLASEERAPG